jgi:hypothetical protein
MSFCTSATVWRKSSVTFIATIAILSAMSISANAAQLYHMVDVQTATGDMVLTLDDTATSYSNVTKQWNYTMVASNTGSNTYKDVNLMLQFVWDQATNPRSALTYTNSNSWGGIVNSNTDSTSFSAYGIGANPTTTPLLAFPWSIADTPLSWNVPGKNLATVSSTDTFPTVPLGDFGPGATETFTLTGPTPSYFLPDIVGLYVAVPEPSSIMLSVVSGIGVLGYVWRRRAMRRNVIASAVRV